MKTMTFRVDNDKGNIVDKTETIEWVKGEIRNNLYLCLNVKLSVEDFTIELVESEINPGIMNTIVVTGKHGQTMTYHYGGFDGCEGVEPYSLDEWLESEKVAS